MSATEPRASLFGELSGEALLRAGGKGRGLARLFRAGYPIPPGLVILPEGFNDQQLIPEVWTGVRAQLARLRGADQATRFAVRSSALAEDSARASFAGGFETVLDVGTDDEVHAAILAVRASARSSRVEAYSDARGIARDHHMAVVVQRMVAADLAGVLFTADPVSGSFAAMVGNYVRGPGEALVSGEADPELFRIERPRGRYHGPDDMRVHARTLYRLAARLEREEGVPQDIEWAVADGRVHLLQARPVTTLSVGDIDRYEVNDSLTEDTLWVNTNVGEAVPDVFTPLTWSLVRHLDHEANLIPGYYIWSGNICGRIYSNIGRRVSVAAAVTGWDARRVMGLLGDLFGPVPEAVRVPLHPYRRRELIGILLPGLWRVVRKSVRASRTLPQFLEQTPGWCRHVTVRIAEASSPSSLLALWDAEIQPSLFRAWWAHTAGSARIVTVMTLDRKLSAMVGKEDANALLSNLRGEGGLASLGPLLALARVRDGVLGRAAYLEQYGHRGPHEFELSIPTPAEQPERLEQELQHVAMDEIDVDGLLERQRERHQAVLERFAARFPRKVRWLDRQLARAARGAHSREAVRSEFTRVFRVVRTFALRGASLCRVDATSGDVSDVFFLYIDELLALLGGSNAVLRLVPARRANYRRYQSLPPFPPVIRGRFDPAAWLQDPHRRGDYFDPEAPVGAADSDLLKGYPGAAGRVEGVVRVLSGPAQGDTLRPGEILVTTTTNVGWTPLFPRAAAIVTDVGAPLSHAAIVARELGIPAVVGCGLATTLLSTGDRVLVDGGQGIVRRLEGST